VTSVTIILANYNHARYLPYSLGSLLRQTRQPDEFIVTDDASTDDSVAVIERLIRGVPYARLERNPGNLGCIETHNRVLPSVRSDVVLLAAADDVYYPKLIETGLAQMDAFPQAGIFSARSDLMDADGRNVHLFDTPMPIKRAGYLSPSESAKHLMRDDSWFMGNVSLYHRGHLLAEGGMPEEFGSFADGYMARVLALKHGACFTPEVLGAWRRMETGMAMSHINRVDDVKAMIARVQVEMRDCGTLFPAGYAERWGNRYLFGAYRAAARQRRLSRAGLARGVTALCDAIAGLWLFLRLRPFDIESLLRRRADSLLRPLMPRKPAVSAGE
jgi:hypothetical protein